MATAVVSRNRPAPMFVWLQLATDLATPQAKKAAELDLNVAECEYMINPRHGVRAMRVGSRKSQAGLYVTYRDDFYVGPGIESVFPKQLVLLNQLLPPMMHLADMGTHYALLVDSGPKLDGENGTKTEFCLANLIGQNLWASSDEVHTWKRKAKSLPI